MASLTGIPSPSFDVAETKGKAASGSSWICKINCCSKTINENDRFEVDIEAEETSVEQKTDGVSKKCLPFCCFKRSEPEQEK